ncbi:MAG: hypothetical protein LUQ62_05870 [Methanomicrobiales archaeon]|nr:hypothetical protein [Methanomicrobiales archaeon]
MKHWIPILVMALIVALAAGAGCASTNGGATTTVPTTVPETPTATPAETTPVTDPMQPGPTVTSPPGLDTSITVSRNPSTYQPDIIVTYGGGSGNLRLQRLDIRVTRSDGVVKTAEITRPSASDTIRMQTSVRVEGSRGSDRVEVTAWYSGVAYKIYDAVVPAITRP